MPDHAAAQSADRVIDVRAVPPEQCRPLVFNAYEQLAIGQALILISDDDAQQLRQEFDLELAGSFAWEPMPTASGIHQTRMTKRARTALPRLVADTSALLEAAGPGAGGAIWHLDPERRDIDSNVIALPPESEIGLHEGPDLDVLILILHGSGEMETELSVLQLHPGALIWLPRLSRRRFCAGRDGLRYLTLHRRKPTLNITDPPTLVHED